MATQKEYPYQTYERITGKKWPGGKSPEIVSLLRAYGITAQPGSAEANLALQRALLTQGLPQTTQKTTTTTPATQTTQTPIMPTEEKKETDIGSLTKQFQSQLASLQRALESLSTATPPQTGLSAEEKRLYEQTLQQLKERYQQELANLERKHQEEKQRLIGRYAAAGFSEPGILEGPMAGVPGIVTKALQELGEQQARERTQLQQAAAGDITAIQMAQAEAERKAQQQAYEQWAREQQRKLENILKQAGLLETIYSYVAPQRMTVGGRILVYDPLSGSYRDVTPESIMETIKQEEIEKAWSLQIDDEGNVWRVNPLTGQMQRIGKVAVAPKTTPEEKWQIKIDDMGNVWRINPTTGKMEKIGSVEVPLRSGLYTEKTIPSDIYTDLREDILEKKGGLLGGWKYKEEDIIRAYPEVDPQYIRKLIKALRGGK
ncbi:MAG: hypothetical protein QW228_05765 [Candidatus Aenigmatarchaeota archaeon]